MTSAADPNINGIVTMLSALPGTVDDKNLHFEPEEAAFYKKQTGIQDETTLKQHIIQVHDEAYKVCAILGVHCHSAGLI